MENNNMNNNNRGQNNNMTRNENVKSNGKVRNICIAAGAIATLVGGFFIVKKIRARKQEKEKAQQAAEKSAE